MSDMSNKKPKPQYHEIGMEMTPRAGTGMKGLVELLSLVTTQSNCEMNDKPTTPRMARTDVSSSSNKIPPRRGNSLLENNSIDSDPKGKLNLLIGIMVSTIMCLAKNCPVPKSNINATKQFLSTVVTDEGETPKNVLGLLHLLRSYDGPFEKESVKSIKCIKTMDEAFMKNAITPPSEKGSNPKITNKVTRPPVKRYAEPRRYNWKN